MSKQLKQSSRPASSPLFSDELIREFVAPATSPLSAALTAWSLAQDVPDNTILVVSPAVADSAEEGSTLPGVDTLRGHGCTMLSTICKSLADEGLRDLSERVRLIRHFAYTAVGQNTVWDPEHLPRAVYFGTKDNHPSAFIDGTKLHVERVFVDLSPAANFAIDLTGSPTLRRLLASPKTR